jgi:cysteine desulfurase
MPVNFARVDIVSASGHKIGAPKGVGILGMRRRKWALPPVKPLMFGGGQEFGLRPGTLAVPLIAGMAEATRRTKAVAPTCNSATVALRDALLSIARNAGFEPLTDPHVTAPWVIPLKSMTDDSEAVLLRLKHIIAASNGAACTSSAYTKSHVLHALDPSLPGFLRLSIYAPLASRELTRVDSISLRGR